MEEYEKMNIDPLLGAQNDPRDDTNSPQARRRPSAPKSDRGTSDRPKQRSKRREKSNNELIYPYKAPTERERNLLGVEDSIYKDSKNMSLDL